MVSNISEETHHKMSKKIAQLTKVIFHLHSKNEENNNAQTASNNAYEKEIEQLLIESSLDKFNKSLPKYEIRAESPWY